LAPDLLYKDVMKKWSLVLLLVLGACEQVALGTRQGAIMARDEAYRTVDALETYTTLPPYKGEPVKRPVPQSYCYKFQADIVCYNEPQPELANRYVGGQPVGSTPLLMKVAEPKVVKVTRERKGVEATDESMQLTPLTPLAP
jgi:hypothetical protein